MKTISTKLDKTDHERFIDLCNQEGCLVSEALREMITQWCDAVEDGIELEKEKNQIQTPKPIIKIIDYNEPRPEIKSAKVVIQ